MGSDEGRWDPLDDHVVPVSQLDELPLDPTTGEAPRLSPLDDSPLATEQLEELDLDPFTAEVSRLALLEDEPMATEQLDELELEEGIDLPPLRPIGEEVLATEQLDEIELAEEDEDLEEFEPTVAFADVEDDAPPAPPVAQRFVPPEESPEEFEPTDFELARDLHRPPAPTRGLHPEVEGTEMVGRKVATWDEGTEIAGGFEAVPSEKVWGFDEDDDEVGHTELIDRDDLLAPDRVPERAAAAPEAPAPETPWAGLHPASLLVNLIPRTWRTLSSLWPLFLALLVGGQGMGINPGDGAFLLIFLASGFANTVVHFLTLRYRVHGGKLEIRQGLLNRQARVIDPARIQNVSLVRNPFHKLSGLVEVRIETAGDVRTEGLLSALSVEDAQALMRALDAARGHVAEAEDAAPPEALLRLSLGEIIAYGLSSGSAGKVTLLFAVGLEASSAISPGEAERAFVDLPGQKMAALVLLAFAVSWTFETAVAVIRHHGFTLSRTQERGRGGRVERRLKGQEGLLTRREVQVPLSKVQLAMADEPLLRRSMGYGSVAIETAGLGSMAEGVTQAELVVPMVEQDALGRTLRLAIPQAEVDPWTATLHRPHRRALWRAMMAGSVRSGLVAVALIVFAWPWGLLGLILPFSSMLTAWLDWRFQGWLITPQVVVTRRGFWRRRTWVLARNKLQSVHLVQGPLMRGYGLGRLVVRVAGSQVLLPDLAFDQAEGLLDELKPAPT
ncbi:MAG: PH domain-containing protein [Alphaproteobacteria bacterium]|nr:PH domain-containing protein [Alphaproteobacteria bacterium]